MSAFQLNARLEGDSLFITDLALCTVRLMKDASYPWLLLVPRQNDLIELIDLSPADRHLLMDEIAAASKALQTVTNCEKLNVGALGNQVSQLHVHVIARFQTDAAWPGPIWGAVPAKPYKDKAAEHLIAKLRQAFSTA
ncbi:diadenosine tetraphosphate [Roseibium sp. TrichSKD4]|uniref:HIT domain-containing protein n=1 Tax=Roseibium sp. TrichSKD4 TaxID=744980 RepID=UPI0001E5669B|nr:HIT family protein [Roseibium sp. TrichSKD4]EFO32786.1 diadenosine tetraphosphate [Roseibium sp. TrichSKD4]